MKLPRPTPLTAFLVGTLGIATFSGMDAVMKGLVLALGTYATMVWRMLAGVAMAGALFAARPNRPDASTMRIHLYRGALTTVMAVLFFWGLARVPLAQAIALAFIAPLIALFLAAASPWRNDWSADDRRLADRLCRGAADLRRPGPGRPWPRGDARQLRHPRLGGLLCGQYHPDAPAGAGRGTDRDRLLPESDRRGACCLPPGR